MEVGNRRLDLIAAMLAGARAVTAGQDLAQPFGRLAAGADLDEAAHEVAHHVMQEAVGVKVA